MRKAMTAGSYAFYGIGIDTTTAFAARSLFFATTVGVSTDSQYPIVYIQPPILGYHYASLNEAGDNATSHTTYAAVTTDIYISLQGMF
jgi:hypothetical protein